MKELAAVREAARGLRALPSDTKNRVLLGAVSLLKSRQAEILRANDEDLAAPARQRGRGVSGSPAARSPRASNR